MDDKNNLYNIRPVLVLYILSPIIAELLFGSTPASRSAQLIFESFLYGTGALLIREFARRFKLGWTSIIILGIAFGIIEECLSLQSAFNPRFLGNDLSFGRSLGVNWVWGEYIIGYHAIWSITIPILLTELLFPQRRTRAWLSKIGIGITSGIYLLSCLAFYATFYKMSGFTTSLVHYLISGFLVFGLIILSLRLPVKTPLINPSKTPSVIFVGLIAFLGSSLWLILLSFVFRQGAGLSSWFIELLGVAIILSMYYLILSWVKQNWNDYHRFSLAFGGLMASMLFGLYVLMQVNNKLDQICQMLFIIITIILMVLLRKRIINSKLP